MIKMMSAPAKALRAVAAALALASAVPSPALANSPPPAKPAADPSASRITGAKSYFPTFGLNASISRNFVIRGVLAVDAGLDIPSEKVRKQAEQFRPRIVSAMREAVLNYASQSYVAGNRPDTDMLRGRMQKAVDGVLPKGSATVVLASVIILPK
jgi:hypothetical protein